MLKLYINGQQYLGYTDFRCYKSIKDFCGSFEITTSTEYQQDYPLKIGDAINVKVLEKNILTGYVDWIVKNIDSSNNNISIKGRSKTSDIVDSTLVSNNKNNKGIDFKVIIERILKSIGITNISVISKVGVLKVLSYDTENVAENAFDFLEVMARKLNVLLTTNGDGNIEIVRAIVIRKK